MVPSNSSHQSLGFAPWVVDRYRQLSQFAHRIDNQPCDSDSRPNRVCYKKEDAYMGTVRRETIVKSSDTRIKETSLTKASPYAPSVGEEREFDCVNFKGRLALAMVEKADMDGDGAFEVHSRVRVDAYTGEVLSFEFH